MQKWAFFLPLFLLAFFAAFNSTAQTVLIDYNFNNYNGNVDSIPGGWSLSWNTGTSFYSSAAFSGLSGPNSYKFGNNNVTVTTPSFQYADTVSFWIKASSNVDAWSTLIILETTNDTDWDTIAKVNDLPTTAKIVKYKVNFNAIRLQFIYQKSTGNLAFDDFQLIRSKQVIADFAAQSICIGDTASFIDLSTTAGNTTIAGRHWDFGDDSISQDLNPVHLFSSPGTYPVKLVVTDNLQFKDSVSHVFSVYEKPIADFGQSADEICQNEEFILSNNSTSPSDGSIATWSWSFGDGSPKNKSTWDAVHNFLENGNMQLQLIVSSSNLECSDTAMGTVLVYEAPVADFTYTVNGQQVDFVSNPLSGNIAHYSWNFGDGSSPATSPDTSHTYASEGVYTVCLSVIDSNDCKEETCEEIAIVISGIENNEAGNKISIYPNPSDNGMFTIDLGQYKDSYIFLTVVNMLGTALWEKEILKNSLILHPIDLFIQPAGYYFIQIKTGKEVITREIIINK